MSLISTITKAISGAAKAYKAAQKNKTSSSSTGSSSKSTSNSSMSGGNTASSSTAKSSSSGYKPLGSNTDAYIRDTNASDYAAIQSAKQAYAEAQAKGDKTGMTNANAAANAVRAKYGYSGGSDGSQYIALPQEKEDLSYENPYEDAINEVQERYAQIAQQQKEANALAIKQGTDRLESQKDSINQSYDENARQAYIANMKSKKNLPQQLAASGVTGGATETANLNLQTNYENNLNDININRVNAINDIDNAINELKNNGDLSAAEQALATSQSALSAYQNLLSSKINYDIAQKENAFNSELSTIGQYSNDYQAEIDRRTAINPNDPLIPYLVAARQEKINAQEESKNANISSAVEQERELAWKLFQETGKADSYIEAVLGIPAGTTTLDYSKNQYDINKPYYKTTTESSTSDNSKVNYQTHKNIVDNNYAVEDAYGNVTGYDTQSIINYANNEKQNGRISESDANSLLAYYGIDYMRQTNEYKTVAAAVGRATSFQEAEQIIFGFEQQGLDENIVRKLYQDLENGII